MVEGFEWNLPSNRVQERKNTLTDPIIHPREEKLCSFHTNHLTNHWIWEG